jgi:hypothetical protein
VLEAWQVEPVPASPSASCPLPRRAAQKELSKRQLAMDLAQCFAVLGI